jgi:hypothetical protein
MKNLNFIIYGSLMFAATDQVTSAQVADVPPSKQRDEILNLARGVLVRQNEPVVIPNPLPDPFTGKIEEVVQAESTQAPKISTGPELLARIAAQMPASGTANLGGQWLLLLGQKRLKVGDSVTISFEGQNYDLSIAAISSTTFTVKLGSNTHTRATRISTSSNQSRP